MPYFVYTIRGARDFQHIDTFDAYRPARVAVRSLREGLAAADDKVARMIFAASTAEAERLLAQKREPPALGED